ncbi:hypothetical protein HU200_010094 [Digitaria exilis]|uniref:Uncharacterized protein n=1 Tax=Digitaria exilis TaxID=1010633 RepID=A0A835FI06_9POAL|nr:hypothetical protein HU200_010094 [Digitaria exilis]
MCGRHVRLLSPVLKKQMATTICSKSNSLNSLTTRRCLISMPYHNKRKVQNEQYLVGQTAYTMVSSHRRQCLSIPYHSRAIA